MERQSRRHHLGRSQRDRLVPPGTWRAVALIVLVLLSGAAPRPLAPAAGGASADVPAASALAAEPFAAPEPADVTAEAAYVLDASAGTELYALAPDEPLPPASLTKVATALVVLRHADLDDRVAIEEGDLVDDTQSQVGLEAGDTLSVRDLLAGLLIPSGNDAAQALARHVGGDLLGADPTADEARAAFIAEMNGFVAEMGLDNTHFANASGIDEKDHYASARDLALLTAEAMRDPTFAEIVGSASAVLPSETRAEGYPVATTNDLLRDGLVEGVKTGTTSEAGGCLISAFSVGENQVVAVVLGSDLDDPNAAIPKSTVRFDDMRQIITAAPVDYRWLDPSEPGAINGLAEELSVWETELPPGPDLVVPGDRQDELRYRLRLGPPAEANREVGSVLFFVGADLLSERPVLQAEGAAAANPGGIAGGLAKAP